MAFNQVSRFLRWNQHWDQQDQNELPQNGAAPEWSSISFDDTEIFPSFEDQPEYEEPDFHLPPPTRNNTPVSTPRMSTPSSTTCEADQDTTYFQSLSPPRISAASLDKLRDWIDCPPPFAQKPSTTPVYLFKSEFTFAVLMQGLIYAVGKYKQLSSEFRTLSRIASYQYGQDMTGWLEEYGLDMEPERICLKQEIESEWWEIELRNVYLRDDEKELLPRTIVAFARLAEKLAFSNYNMRYGIAALQGDLDVNGLMEEDEEESEVDYEYL